MSCISENIFLQDPWFIFKNKPIFLKGSYGLNLEYLRVKIKNIIFERNI